MRILHSRKLIFISKPRCGSTSVRRFLDSLMVEGDEKCDYANEFPSYPELHPHMSAPAVQSYLKSKKIDIRQYTTFTVIRNPLDMLWSYFKPDINSNYYYSTEYNDKRLSNFNWWLQNGKVGIGLWKSSCPPMITSNDFTPLSLEAHAYDELGKNCIDKIFKIEDIEVCVAWLTELIGEAANIPKINSSDSAQLPDNDKSILQGLIKQFPEESKIYKLNNGELV